MRKLRIALVSFLVLMSTGFAQAATIRSSTMRAEAIAEDNSGRILAEDEGDGSFTMDSIAPFVETSNPLPGATNVPLEVDFSVTFSEPMNEASVFNSLLKLENLNTGSALDNLGVSLQTLMDWGTLSASFNASWDVLSITSTTNLEPNTTYRITIIKPITATDLAGNVLLPYMGETQFLFTTIGDPLTAASVIQSTGRVDLVVTDPMGRTIRKNEPPAIPSASYIEFDFNGDGNPDDRVVVPGALMGNYLIEIVPEVGATGTYTLVVIYGGETITLAENRAIRAEPHSFFFPQRMMVQGWNLISVPVNLPNYTIGVAFQSIISNCSTVWTYETTVTGGEWKRYARNLPFLSNLGTIVAGRGYWVRMAAPAVLTLDGDQVAAYPPDLMKPGWVLAGYNGLEAERIENVLPPNCNAVWTYNLGDGGWKRYIVGGSDNDLEWMKPGEGYWMNISGSAPPAPVWLPVASTDRPGIPYTIWGNVEIDGVKVASRGSAPVPAPTVLLKVDDEVRSSYQLGTVARYEDFYVLDVPETDKSPLTPLSQRGESFGSAQVELYIQVEDTLIKAGPVPPGKAGEIMRLDLSVRIPPEVSVLHQNYPNPFNPDTWIPYQLKEDAHVMISIYTATGQLVRTLNLGRKPAGFYTNKESAAYWDGRNEEGENVSSGIYFYSIQAGDLAASRKMAIVK